MQGAATQAMWFIISAMSGVWMRCNYSSSDPLKPAVSTTRPVDIDVT
jgi:hypothetical protein